MSAAVFLLLASAAPALGASVSVHATAPTAPVWPTNWVASEASTIQLVNGQTARTSAISYFDGTNNRTASTNITGSQFDTIVTDYDADGGQGKVYYFRTYGTKKDPTPVRHCQFWCTPTGGGIPCNQDDSLCSFDYKKKARFLGAKTIDGKQTNEFFWTENLGPIPMNSLDLYTTQDAANPMPVRMFRDLHPFGKKLGNTTIDYASFAAQTTPFASSIFDLGPDAKYACADPQPSDQCQTMQAQQYAWRRM